MLFCYCLLAAHSSVEFKKLYRLVIPPVTNLSAQNWPLVKLFSLPMIEELFFTVMKEVLSTSDES